MRLPAGTLGLAVAVAMLAVAPSGARPADGRIYYSHLSRCSAGSYLCTAWVESVAESGRGVTRARCTTAGVSCVDRFVIASPRSRRIAIATDGLPGTDGVVRTTISVLGPGGRVERQIRGIRELFQDFDWSPDGSRFVANVESPSLYSKIKLIDWRGRTRTLAATEGSDISWSRQNTLAWTNLSGVATLRSVRSGGHYRVRLRGNGVAFSPDGLRLAFVRADGTYISDLRGRYAHRVSRRCSNQATDVTWSPSERYLACVAKGGGVAVIDLYRQRSSLIVRDRRVTSIAWARK